MGTRPVCIGMVDASTSLCINFDKDCGWGCLLMRARQLQWSKHINGGRGCIDKILRKNISPKINCKVWIIDMSMLSIYHLP